MKFQYQATFRVDLGKAIPEIGDMLERVNAGVSNAGYSEKLSLMHDGLIPPLVVTADRELKPHEQEKMKAIILENVQQHFPQYDVRLVEFRRKSGHVSQEAL